ncbi:MAG: HAMP domain-containing histidine kinase [Desulfovibrionaceae bacterium]|nr:HAMP domain-containing histidine kinase [Desulfovibrionaceae bacterium]MBF0514609.1 HAMP domain-containing histidine kinase [Desulfovibrionaceae bacterium]
MQLTGLGHITRFGIVFKIFSIFIVIFSIIYFTTSGLFIHIKTIVGISRDIVQTRFEVHSLSQKLMESLFTMEENQKKYGVLGQNEYKDYYAAAMQEYEKNLDAMQVLPKAGELWRDLSGQLRQALAAKEQNPQDKARPWIDVAKLDDWMQTVQKANRDNDALIETNMRALYFVSEEAVRKGVYGLTVSILAGLAGCALLVYSLSRPLRELRRGIRAFTQDGKLTPVRVVSRDELGELGAAFNEMTTRLTEEEKMRVDFIDMLSHEIRTPLTSIRESVNLIKEKVFGEINERQRKFLDIAAVELERISKLLSRLMQVSAMSPEIIALSPQIVDPAALVAETVDKALPGAAAKDISVQIRVAANVPETFGDYDHLQQALLNLIGNAVKFSPPGSTVDVSVEPADEGRQVLFGISDNGPGIPEPDQPYVFNKYYRGARMKNVEGVGLGLCIAKNIVEAHGGKIWLSSRPGKGAMFYFTIPVRTGRR